MMRSISSTVTAPAVRSYSFLVETLGRDGTELIVTDTAPHSGAEAVAVPRLSDHIRIPLQPSFPDLAAIIRTIDIAEVARTRRP